MLHCAVARSLWVRGHACRARSLPGPTCPESNVAKASSLCRRSLRMGPKIVKDFRAGSKAPHNASKIQAGSLCYFAPWLAHCGYGGHACRARSLPGPTCPESNVAKASSLCRCSLRMGPKIVKDFRAGSKAPHNASKIQAESLCHFAPWLVHCGYGGHACRARSLPGPTCPETNVA